MMSLRDNLMADFRQMIAYRKSVGFATKTYEYTLTPFIECCAAKYPNAPSIEKHMVDEWLASHPYRTRSTQSIFISMLRQLTCFLNALGRNAYIPDRDYSVKREKFRPYVLKDHELSAFFSSVDDYFEPYNRYIKTYRPDLILPVLFRMMYCCGMRPSEPLRLKEEDVRLDTGSIYISQTKHNKDRHIIMSEDMKRLCRTYKALIGANEWFFPHPRGGRLSTGWMTYQFHACWNRSGLEKRGNPRPYDLRHAFATRTMMRWIDSGKDVMTLLPYLSTYLGHAEFTSTLYYIHLLPDRMRKSSGIDWNIFGDVYEEGEK